jgi:O-antigen/teichoic acid export membrane protein
MLLTKKFGFSVWPGNIKYGIEILTDSLVNMPFKMSKAVVVSLSVILLVPLGVSTSDVGVFYITVMITLVAGSLASSIALMVIPASYTTNIDFSIIGARIGLSLTAPLIAALIVAPKFILSLIGPQYMQAETVLLILSFGILPFSATYNAISGLNNRGEQRKIVLIGVMESCTFLITLLLLVPHYGIIGAAYSILISFLVSCVPSMIWLGKKIIKYTATTALAIAIGYFTSYLVSLIIGPHYPILIAASVVATLAAVFMLKNTSTNEIRELVRSAIRKQ